MPLVNIWHITIADLADELQTRKSNDQRVALILGSRAGGLFRSQYFYDLMSMYSMLDFSRLSRQEQFMESYNVLSRRDFSPSDLQTIHMRALEGIKPGNADISLARLVQQGLFQTIISNNADDLLEQAFVACGMEGDFRVVTLKQASDYRLTHLFCELIKLRDDSSPLPLDQRAYSQGSLEPLHVRGEVFVVGLDPLWDSDLLNALSQQVETLWLVGEDAAIKHVLELQYSRVGQINHVLGANDDYEIIFPVLDWFINKPKAFLPEKSLYEHFHTNISISVSCEYRQGRDKALVSLSLQGPF